MADHHEEQHEEHHVYTFGEFKMRLVPGDFLDITPDSPLFCAKHDRLSLDGLFPTLEKADGPRSRYVLPDGTDYSRLAGTKHGELLRFLVEQGVVHFDRLGEVWEDVIDDDDALFNMVRSARRKLNNYLNAHGYRYKV